MDKLFENTNDYIEFLSNVSLVAGYIEYKFTYEFENKVTQFIDSSILEKLKVLDDNIIETKLLNLIYDNRISIEMKSANPYYKHNKTMIVKVVSVLDDKIIEGLKGYDNFYSIDQEFMDEEYIGLLQKITKKTIPQELVEVINNEYYGPVEINFTDKQQQPIINIYCHEGSFIVNENYEFLFFGTDILTSI